MIFLSRPARMKKLSAIYPAEYRDRVLLLLQEAGVVDIVQQDPSKILREYESLKRLHEDIMNILSKVKGVTVRAELTGLEVASLTLDKIKSDVDSILALVSSQEQEINRLKRRMDELRTLDRILSKIPSISAPKTIYYRGKRISSILVLTRKDTVESIVKSPLVKAYEKHDVTEDQVALLLYLESTGFDEFINSIKPSCMWHPGDETLKLINESSSIVELRSILQRELVNSQNKLVAVERELEDTIKRNLWLLGKYLLYVENTIQRYLALGTVQSFKHVSMIVGWIPEDLTRDLTSKLSISEVPVYIEFSDPDQNESPPTLMRNKPVLNFYQVITRLYGVPGYREWDPTPLLAYSFALFFGLMNSDVGYSLVGILATLFLLDKVVENSNSPAYREFKGVLLVSNVIALILGFLSGSVFGNLLQIFLGVSPPVIFAPLSNPLDFIKLSIVVGLVHVNTAHVLATIKYTRERRFGELFIEVGLIIGEVFGIPYILDLFLRYKVPILGAIPESVLLAGSIAGVCLIIAGSLMTLGWLGLLMWIFQITGLLGDVLSYVRLAGVGLATYYMASIFNFMNEMILNYFSGINYFLGIVLATPLLIVSNLLILMLAQLGAFIHSLRLCILEFLTKFYEGSGREYNPLRVVYRTVIVLK